MDEDCLGDILERHGIKEPVCASDLPPGWRHLVDDLFREIIALGWDRELHQIKEKFGGLRVYIGRATDEIHERIYDAERRSLCTCEECGAATGKRKDCNGYIRTLCNHCYRAGDRQGSSG